MGFKRLIDAAIPGDRNVINKEAEKILKYKDLTAEIQRMWNVQAAVIPVIMRSNGTISKTIQKIPNQRTAKARNQGLTENSHTAHILRK